MIMRKGRRRNGYLLMLALVAGTSSAFPAEPPAVVVGVCAGCHGVDGLAPWPQVPRLAGQNAAYLQAQIIAFQRTARPPVPEVPPGVSWPDWFIAHPIEDKGNRDDPNARKYMVGVARLLTPAENAAAALWYAEQPAGPGSSEDPALLKQGRALFETGIVMKAIPGCQDCHGDKGQGLGQFPRLAGQHAAYLQRQILAFQKGQRAHAGVMATVAKGLTPDEARAVAVYLQSLP